MAFDPWNGGGDGLKSHGRRRVMTVALFWFSRVQACENWQRVLFVEEAKFKVPRSL